VHCAWRKHGEPVCTVLAEFDSQDDLHAAEIAAISEFGTMSPDGYNVSIGGDTAPSINPEVAAKISARAKGRKYKDTSSWVESTTEMWKDESYRKKVSIGLKAAWSDEMRKSAGERLKARWERRKAEGWVMPEATKKKLREKNFSAETRAKMSDAAKGKPKAPRTDKTRKKLSESTAASWANPEIKKRRSEAIREALAAKRANQLIK